MTKRSRSKISEPLTQEVCVECSFRDEALFILGDELRAENGNERTIQTQLADGPGIFGYYSASKRYGTQSTVAALQRVGAIWEQRRSSPRIGIGDISLRNGGDIDGHASHETGRDVDIRPPMRNGLEGPVTWHSPDYSRSLTQELVDLIYVNGFVQVKLFLFNDPSIEGTSYYNNHDNHLHVRFHFADERSGYPIVRIGANNSPPVRELQRRLNNWAHGAGIVERLGPDGDFGQRTDTMIRRFQLAHGIGSDGVAGGQTWPATEAYVV